MATLYGYVSNTGAPEYDDILNSDLPKEEKVKQIKMRGQQYEDEINREYLKDMAKLIGGAALQIGSAAIPMGAGARLAGGLAKGLMPYVGKKIAQEVGTGLVGGGLSGGVFGFGRGLMEDKNPLLTAGQDALLGTAMGGAVGYGAGQIGKKIAFKNLLNNPENTKFANYYDNYVDGLKDTAEFSRLSNAARATGSDYVIPGSTREVLYDSANPRHRLQADLINKYNPAHDNYHTWVRNADDIYNFEDTLKPPQFDPDFIGNDFDPSYTWDMAQDAIKNGEMEVFSSYPIEKGVFVTPSTMEAQSYAGSGKIYSKKVPLDDVAWIDERQGQYAPIDKEYMESALSKTQDEIDQMTSQEFKDFENLGLDYYSKYLQDAPVTKEGYGDIYFSGNNKGKDFTANFRHYPTLKEQLRTSEILKRGSNYKNEKDRVYDYLQNTKDGEVFNYTIEDIKGKGKKYKKMKSNSYYLSHRKKKK